jgi:hypothetical protein
MHIIKYECNRMLKYNIRSQNSLNSKVTHSGQEERPLVPSSGKDTFLRQCPEPHTSYPVANGNFISGDIAAVA